MEFVQPIVGFFILLLLGAIFSENIKAIKIKFLIIAVVIQVVLAYILINPVSYTHLTLPTKA